MKERIEEVLGQRTVEVEYLEGFKAQKLEGTDNICECSEDGGDGCSE